MAEMMGEMMREAAVNAVESVMDSGAMQVLKGDACAFWMNLIINIGIFLLYTLGAPPPKSDKTLYTGIYLPTFREGTNFIIKLLVSCLGALTGPGGGPP